MSTTPSLFINMSEDKFRVCGEHLGYGDPAFHIGICGDCPTRSPSLSPSRSRSGW